MEQIKQKTFESDARYTVNILRQLLTLEHFVVVELDGHLQIQTRELAQMTSTRNESMVSNAHYYSEKLNICESKQSIFTTTHCNCHNDTRLT